MNTDPSAPVVTIVVNEVLDTVDVADSTNSVVELGGGGGGVVVLVSTVLVGTNVDVDVDSSTLEEGVVIRDVEGSAEEGGVVGG